MEEFYLSIIPIEYHFNSLLIVFTLLLLLALNLLYWFYKYLAFTNIVVDMSASKVAQYNRCHVLSRKSTEEDIVNQLPPIYPNGWIPIMESWQIKVKQSKAIVALGYDLVVFRGVSAQVFVLNAYCPHLGAHIGVGGQVIGNCIKCPFHGWTFRGIDGVLESKDQLLEARIKVWESIETNGMVYVWHHADNCAPHWFPQKIPEIEDSKWIFRGRTEHIVNCCFQDIPENGADSTHFEHLHRHSFLLGSDLRAFSNDNFISRLFRHEFTSNWSAGEPPYEHTTNLNIINTNYVFGFPLVNELSVRQFGPAIVHLKFNVSIIGGIYIKGAFTQNVIPVEPYKHRIIHHIYTEPTFKGLFISRYFLHGEARMVERDIVIWNNKKFLRNALFTRDDKAIVKYRRWFMQFYSQNSYKICHTINKRYEW